MAIIDKIISVGKIKKNDRSLSNKDKAWGKINSTTKGTYIIQVKLPDGKVEELTTVTVNIPVGFEAKIDTRTYVNVVEIPEEQEIPEVEEIV